MAQLAIQGHATRGREVIALLEMLGGRNYHNLCGDNSYTYYIIDSDKKIIKGGICVFSDEELLSFTLEQFEEKFPYKVGDMARLSRSNVAVIIKAIKWEKDEIVYQLSCDESGWWSVNNLKPYREKTMETAKITITPQRHWNEDKIELDVAKDYKIKEENGKYYIVRKQFKYPKTYKECCDVLGLNTMDNDAQGHKADLIIRFQELLIARDAYWKIAGEQIGLESWEPYWKNNSDKHFICYLKDELWMSNIRDCNRLLVFPTEKMRDAFYENFKELIEACKELL